MAIYRFSMKHGSRAKGTSAGAHARYILREDRYSCESDELKYSESGNMPEWVEKGSVQFWDAADLYEANNARLYTEFEIALPRELNLEQQVLLIQGFVNSEIGDRHPYTFAVHESDARDGGKNPHVHLMFSTRTHDDYRRTESQFFKRANKKEPWEGGALKDRSWMPKERLIELRDLWEKSANLALERAGERVRIDSRSLKEQGVDREPQPKLSPFEYQLWQKGMFTSNIEQILVLEEIAALQQKQQEISGVIGSLDNISSLRSYMADVEGFLERQQSKIGDLDSRRQRADNVVDRLTDKLRHMPNTHEKALKEARSRVYGRAYGEHALNLKTAKNTLKDAEDRALSKFSSPFEAIRHFRVVFRDVQEVIDKRQDVRTAASVIKEFSNQMLSEETEQECLDLANKMLNERLEVINQRDIALIQALKLRELLGRYEQIASEVSRIITDVTGDIELKEQDLPLLIQKYLALNAFGDSAVGQEQEPPQQQIMSEQLEQAYKLEQAQKLGED